MINALKKYFKPYLNRRGIAILIILVCVMYLFGWKMIFWFGLGWGTAELTNNKL